MFFAVQLTLGRSSRVWGFAVFVGRIAPRPTVSRLEDATHVLQGRVGRPVELHAIAIEDGVDAYG
jgi:hypothetical protein